MLFHGFTVIQSILLVTGILFFLSSIGARVARHPSLSIFFLMVGAGSFFFFASSLDPFLNHWDERFHALVAKNLMHHPLMPTLYDDPVLAMPYDRWDRAVIWLHKQPLFLWQIALSFKLFGISEWSLRLPSVLMATATVFFAFRIGKQLMNERVGYLSAWLTATSFHLVELVSGRAEVDHCDVAFLFYVTGSIWSWVEYARSGKRIWILLTGIFSGGAILCKWLVGLLVYAGWVLYNLMKYTYRIGKYGDLSLSLLVTLAVVLPWQILIFSWYPAEASEALKYNAWHFFSPLEGHGGSYWYHILNFTALFGPVATWLVLPAAPVFILRSSDRPLGIAFLSMPVLVFLFFSAAATKMPSYPFILAVPVFLTTAVLLDWAFEKVRNHRMPAWLKVILVTVCLLSLGWANLRPVKVLRSHSLLGNKAHYINLQREHKEFYTGLRDSLPRSSVLFNLPDRSYVECMFYTGFPAYGTMPSEEQVADLTREGRTVVLLQPPGGAIPYYLTGREGIILITPVIR